MTVRGRGITAARRVARDLLKRWGVQRASDIEVEKIATAMGIVIVTGPLKGSRGRLKADASPVIRIADTTVDPGARRFTIAHELGHLLLGHPCHHPKSVKRAERRDDERHYEDEANAFATELLMPRALVALRCQHAMPSLDLAREIATDFRTSLVSTTLRVVELTTSPCAVVYSERGSIHWAHKTYRFPHLARIRGPLPPDVAADLVVANDERPRRVTASRWIDTSLAAELQEHTARVPETGGAITMLSFEPAIAKALRTANAT
ncbi:MAG: ImmA/IrrE family metallo-endopeptidase [Kofleriaceae bacterium]